MAVAGLAACGGDGGPTPAPRLSECGAADSSVPITAVKRIDPETIRFVYPRLPEDVNPCGLATERYRRVLYVELRAEEAVRRPYEELACVDAEIGAAGASLRLEQVSGTRTINGTEPEALFASDARCPLVSRMQPSFILD